MPFGLFLWNWDVYGLLGSDERLEAGEPPRPLLRASGVTLGRPDGAVLLDDVELSLAGGEIAVLAGPAGSGKTALLRWLGGQGQGVSGTVEIEGRRAPSRSRAQRESWRRLVALVTADDALLPSRSVLRNLALPLEIARWPRAQVDRRLRELIELLELQGLEERYPRELSAGERLRAAVGRALAQNAKVLLLDDVAVALPVSVRERLFGVLRALSRQQGLTVLLTARDPEPLRSLDPRLLWLRDGRIAGADAPALAAPPVAHAELSDRPLPCGQAVLRLRFDGASAGQPVLSDLVRQHNLSLNLLEGNLGSSGGRPRGDLVVALPFVGEWSLQQVIEFLADRQVRVELLGHRPGYGCDLPQAAAATDWRTLAALPLG